jgi:hypothetical protein
VSEESEWISVSEIARLHGKHKSAIHKIVNRLRLETRKQKSDETRGQIATYITVPDYRRIASELEIDEDDETTEEAAEETYGVFYLVQLEPELDAGRFKVGFASDISQRLRKHKTAAPLSKLVKTWPCKLLWEKTAIDCVSIGCERLYTEVFRTADLGKTIALADQFFALMPRLDGAK